MIEMVHDEKAKASFIFGSIVRQTSRNYPDSRFHPRLYKETPHYTIAGIDPSPFQMWVTGDGVGTKPELAERLYEASLKTGRPLPEVWEGLAYDTLAMIEGDELRFGRYMVGAVEIIDMNSALDLTVVGALAKGLKAACDEGRFALLNGETAELGYRTSGYGKSRVNWNAVGVSVFTPDKLIFGEDLQPGQPIVALREKSIRSNGLSMARAILEADYLVQHGYASKEDYIFQMLDQNGVRFDRKTIISTLTNILGHNALEQVLPPWHELHPEVTRQLLTPSRMYGPLMYEAQGKIDEPRRVDIIAAAHITGGGIPEKTRRMVEGKGLGLALEAVFPDPEAVSSLLEIAAELPHGIQRNLNIDDKTASEHWNRGIGFVVVTRTIDDANNFVQMAHSLNYEAAIAGKVTDKPEVSWRGQTWNYKSN